MNCKNWIKELHEKRLYYEVSQSKLAAAYGISQQQLSKIESGKVELTEEKYLEILQTLERFNPEVPLELIFDYVRIRFQTTDTQQVLENILKLKMKYFGYEEYGFYGYDAHYFLGDVMILVSAKEELGVMLELKGKGCRQFECYLNGQQRTWIQFFGDCLAEECVLKRIDLAVNDKNGILDIPFLIRKCENEECISVFRSFEIHRSGELVRNEEENRFSMGNTLYLGSKKSEIYFCIYEKDYEQHIKYGTTQEEMDIKNRFEIRLKNERAYQAILDLILGNNPEQTIFGIIDRYVCFVDKDKNKSRSEWKPSKEWLWFLGENRKPLRLTMKPEPYTIQKTQNWIGKQVAPSLKMLEKIDSINQTSHLKEMLKNAKLSEKQCKIIEQQKAKIEDIIYAPCQENMDSL